MSKEPPDDVMAAAKEVHSRINYRSLDVVSDGKGKWRVQAIYNLTQSCRVYANGWVVLVYKQGANKWEYTHVAHVTFADFYPKTGDIIEAEYTVLHYTPGTGEKLDGIIQDCSFRTDDEIKKSFLDCIATSEPNHFTEEHMYRFESKYYRWKGPVECIEPIRRQLFNHWRRCAGEKKPLGKDIQIYCMHEDTNCMDQRYITLDPDSWEAPKKRDKVD